MIHEAFTSLEEQSCKLCKTGGGVGQQVLFWSWWLSLHPLEPVHQSNSLRTAWHQSLTALVCLPGCLERKHTGKEMWLKRHQAEGKACVHLPKLEEDVWSIKEIKAGDVQTALVSPFKGTRTMPTLGKLFHKGPCGCRFLFQPTRHTVWPMSCLKTLISWWNECSLVSCWPLSCCLPNLA